MLLPADTGQGSSNVLYYLSLIGIFNTMNVFRRQTQSIAIIMAIFSSILLSGCGGSSVEQPPVDLNQLSNDVGLSSDGELHEQLEAIRLAYDLPALAATFIEVAPTASTPGSKDFLKSFFDASIVRTSSDISPDSLIDIQLVIGN